jgi:hypothetical protein
MLVVGQMKRWTCEAQRLELIRTPVIRTTTFDVWKYRFVTALTIQERAAIEVTRLTRI